jgi:hypothetical protein
MVAAVLLVWVGGAALTVVGYRKKQRLKLTVGLVLFTLFVAYVALDMFFASHGI